MDIADGVINFLRAILGILLLFFIPGYAFSWVFYPIKDQIPQVTRIAYSLVLSIASVMVGVLFIDVGLGIDTTPINIIIIIIVMSVLAIIVWRFELIYLNSNFRNGFLRNISRRTFSKLNLISLKQKMNDMHLIFIRRKIEKETEK